MTLDFILATSFMPAKPNSTKNLFAAFQCQMKNISIRNQIHFGCLLRAVVFLYACDSVSCALRFAVVCVILNGNLTEAVDGDNMHT